MRSSAGWLLVFAACAVATPVAASQLACPHSAVLLPVSAAELPGITLTAGSAEHWHLRVAEFGVDFRYALGGASAEVADYRGIDLRPPRLASVVLTGVGPQMVQLQRASPGKGQVSLTLDCSATAAQQEKDVRAAACFAEVSAALLAKDAAVLSQPRSGECGLLARHARASLLSLGGNLRELEAEYAELSLAWTDAGEPARAAAAHLGRADALYQLGRMDAALSEASTALAANRQAGIVYYQVRALETIAIVHSYHARLKDAQAAYREALALALASGEIAAATNIRVNLGSLLRLHGDLTQARTLLNEARAQAPADLTPVALGRMYMLDSELALMSADPQRSLQAAAQAQAQFLKSNAKAQIAIAQVLRGRVYASLGMVDEAYRSYAQSLQLIPAAEAPVRVARTLIDVANLLKQDGYRERARALAAHAGRIYGLLGLPLEAGWAGLLESEAAYAEGQPDATAQLAALGKRYPALIHYPSFCLLKARADLLAKQYARALEWLDSAQCRASGLQGQIEATIARAQAQSKLGQVQAARAELIRQREYLTTLGASSSNAAVGFLVARYAEPLRAAFVGLAQEDPPVTARDWWAMARPAPAVTDTSAAGVSAPGELSAFVGRALIGPEPQVPEASSESALLKDLARGQARSDSAHMADLAELQQSLPPDAWLLDILPGETQSVGLWISATAVTRSQLPPRAVLREQLAALQRDLDDPRASIQRVDAAIDQLSASLFTGAPAASAPARLWVLADGLVGVAPLPALKWPGSADALIETTELSWVTEIATRRTAATTIGNASERSPVALSAIVASNTGLVATDKLAPLYNADFEPGLIASARPDLPVTAHLDAAANRGSLITALQTPGAIVHLAAHGYAQPGLLGYAGVWLAPASGTPDPQFLSWLDIADTHLSAALVVLNACQLAAGPSATSQASQSFAAAVSGAGVDHVIAAFWPVSDTASAVWVPAFYRALDLSDPGSSANALRQAQLALKHSRHFRHPYYWASLGHFRRLNLEPAGTHVNPAAASSAASQ